jgi:phosphate starvation-inducible PhoH-like protein
MERDVVEIVPLAFMRGRTLNNTFIILDEGQNTTVTQMKMFLTRMGNGSKVVVTGDITQVDLPPHMVCGLTDAMARLAGIDRVGIVEMTGRDIVRHRLVKEIVRAYEKDHHGQRSHKK